MNSKKRKLKYIREKNHYRLGGERTCVLKVTNELSEHPEYFELWVTKTSEDVVRDLEKKFKMPFKLARLETGLMEDDFLKNLSTLVLYFKVAKE